MELTINWLAVAVATIISVAIAYAWYSPKGFNDPWTKITGVKKAGTTPLVLLFVTNFITALALTTSISIVAAYFNNDSIWLALGVGFALWMAFAAATLLQHNAFEHKPYKLTLINSGYELTIFIAMALAIGLMGN